MTPQKIYLKDYTPPTHKVISTELFFDLHEDFCRVEQSTKFKAIHPKNELFLNGENLELTSLKLNGEDFKSYKKTEVGILLDNLPEEFSLKIETKIYPQKNTSLEGLYKSGGIFCTQCEAEGFRKITYFMDRPDVMTSYRVKIEADISKYPVLLSNGDLINKEKISDNRHVAIWEDPHKKPCYLFALVAGDLGCLKDHFITRSGKNVQLEIYSSHGTQDRCLHAMESLKKSMKWDEQRFGREYDLGRYMILAVDDFNAGAMENKGLNIFNSRLVFADSRTATDQDYFNIESVVAHEYFHNWTGNRVTLRDWFHLSLKEGLTVFRDQEFSMDMSSASQIRINSVADLRSSQFAEDAGPNAHAIRPESCYAVDNFFTSTIYEKGAEVIRMMQTMVGRPGFRKGMDLYFSRHDGQAVIIEDFAKAIADANNQEWNQFKLWYSQAGTPEVAIDENYNHQEKKYKLTLTQTCAPTPGQDEKKPFHIPLVIGLLDPTGKEIQLKSSKIYKNSEGQNLIHLKEKSELFEFENIVSKPVLSINRHFSAPINLKWQQAIEDLIFLLKNDTDAFNQWEASQKIQINEFTKLLADKNCRLEPKYLDALTYLLSNDNLYEEFKSSLLELPDDSYILQLVETFKADDFFQARKNINSQFSISLNSILLKIYSQYHGKNIFSKDAKDFGKRSLKNKALSLLCEQDAHVDIALKQFTNAEIMTDEIAAFSILCNKKEDLKNFSCSEFYNKWKNESLVINKWFAIQALSTSKDTFQTVVKLTEHHDFNIKNPNRVYSLLLRFGENLVCFHDPQVDSYAFMADRIIEIDKINPQVATRVAGCFDVWKKLDHLQQQKAHRELDRMIRSGLSANTYEIISKQLA